MAWGFSKGEKHPGTQLAMKFKSPHLSRGKMWTTCAQVVYSQAAHVHPAYYFL